MSPMTTYTDQELENMLKDVESDLIERKESLRGDAPTKVRDTVCAFANDLPNHRRGGVIFIGAKDDGTPANLPITDELLLQIADIKTDGNILPPPTLTVSKRTLLGAEMAVIIVEPSDSPPVRHRGRIQIRIGPRQAIASSQDERMLNERRRFHDQPFDMQPHPYAKLSDLDKRFFEENYLPTAFSSDVLEANSRTYEQRLASTKMIAAANNPVPTILGLLVLSSRTRDFIPGAYIQFLRIAGNALGDPILDELSIDGTLTDVLLRIDDKLLTHNRTAVDYTSGTIEHRTQPYPLSALQQLVRNAVMHRTYEATNTPVRVTWYDDRIEIVNPGGPYGVVNPENFGEPGVTDYRNPNLAEALRVLGFVQRYGVGIPTARRALKDNGNPPLEFNIQPTFVGVTVRSTL